MSMMSIILMLCLFLIETKMGQVTPRPTYIIPRPLLTPRPTRRATLDPTRRPTVRPTRRATLDPTRRPTARPTRRATRDPTPRPTPRPTRTPTRPRPTRRPTQRPSRRPTRPRPTRRPTQRPSRRPTRPRPTRRPTQRPSRRPTRPRPTRRPTQRPTGNPPRVLSTSCRTVVGGRSGSRDDSRSSIRCPSGYDMTSCGIWGAWGNIDGSYISGTTCYAQMGHGSSGSQYVRAYARCCRLSPTQTCISYRSVRSGRGDDARISRTCPSGRTLTGCTAQSNWKEIDGAYPGLLNGRIITQRCIAQNGHGGNGVYAYAQCCGASNSRYRLQCIARTGPRSGKADDALSRVTCTSGYFLSGCSAYSPWKSAEAWYIYGSECRAKNRHGGNGVYAVAICCQEQFLVAMAPVGDNPMDDVNDVNDEPMDEPMDDPMDGIDDVEPKDFDEINNKDIDNKYFGTTIELSASWAYSLIGLVIIVLIAVNCYIKLSDKFITKKPKYAIVYNQSEGDDIVTENEVLIQE